MIYAPCAFERAELHDGMDGVGLRVAPAPKPKKMQPRIWVSADQHFFHGNIIWLCNRPFANEAEMNQAMIDNWNAVVGVEDTVYHLGDFCLGNLEAVYDLVWVLHGHIKLVPGGHDERWIRQLAKSKTIVIDEDILEVVLPIHYLHYNGKRIVLCHFPLESWEQKNYGAIYLHGHSHGRLRRAPNRYDVGVDANHFAPILLDWAIRFAEDYAYEEAT